MNLNKHQALNFFESTTKNIIFNLAFIAGAFILYSKAPGDILIPSLLFLNTTWLCFYIFFLNKKPGSVIHITGNGKWLLMHLMVFFSLNCIFWFPEASRKLFMVSTLLLNITILAAHFFRKQLVEIIAKGLYNANVELPNLKILSRLKGYMANDMYKDFSHSSLNLLQGGDGMKTVAYNSKNKISQVSRVSLNTENDINRMLENAEYTFGNINFGDTLAEWAIDFPRKVKLNRDTIPVRQLNNRILKRFFDIIISLIVIVFFLSWMVPLIGLLIKLETKGPVFFKQLRSGLNNESFWCYKFRSMQVNEKSDELQATKGDARITRIGTFLRKTSLDEFPQFINVFKGEMSIVGPRPHMLKHTEIYSAQIGNYMNRLVLKQGLTGWAQIRGSRGETTEIKHMEERVNLDLWYLQNWSLWLDIKIIFLTTIQILKKDQSVF
ncbi:hypothetical protein BH10BAC2_BH10BAC2_37730 [soil metagenome]